MDLKHFTPRVVDLWDKPISDSTVAKSCNFELRLLSTTISHCETEDICQFSCTYINVIRVSNLINVHEKWQSFPCNGCILKVFANFHVHHNADECLLKLIANFHVHHCSNENTKDFCQF